MGESFRRRCWLKVAALLGVCGSLFQSASCTSDLRTMGEDLTVRVVDTWITAYFNDQFNIPSSPFF